MSGVTDPYQPVERRLRLTRGCLEVLAEFRNPVTVITKNHLVTRDIDVLGELASHGAAAVALSVTSLRPEIQRVMEPRTATPARRLDAIRQLSEAGIPVRVMVAPVVPGLTDEEVPAIIEAAAEAGAPDAVLLSRLEAQLADARARKDYLACAELRDQIHPLRVASLTAELAAAAAAQDFVRCVEIKEERDSLIRKAEEREAKKGKGGVR
jgi:DNA repair photolyase